MTKSTIEQYARIGRLFLSGQLDVHAIELGRLSAADVTTFVRRECPRRSTPSAKYLVAGLRALLRYLHVAELTKTSLASAVPSVAGWRLSSLPRGIDAALVKRLLASCDRRRVVGRRDYAILTLLVRLGLRSAEVAALELDDLDWHRGEILIRGKGHRHAQLPLPADVGEALVAYLGLPRRCPGGCRRVFLRVIAPWGGLTSRGVQRLCPFHADRNPSFFVDVNRQRFVCYGCHVWGNVLDFVRLHEHLATVAEACAWLTGAPQPAPWKKPSVLALSTKQERRWDRLTLQEQLVMNAAGTLYRDALWRNATALEYVRGRGVPNWVVRSCGLGYADGRSLEAYLRKHGGLRVAEDLGLLRRPEPGEDGRPLRERFAGRVVIPEIRGGQPIWFIGRRTGEPGRVKYLTPSGDNGVGRARVRG